MRVSLRAQFYFLVVPFVGALAALLFAMLEPYLAVHRDVLQIERELDYTVAIQVFHDSFTSQTREYADYIVTGERQDAEESVSTRAASRRDLSAWRRMAAEDGRHEMAIVDRMTADHARVGELGATILRLRRNGRKAEATAVLLDEVVPLMTTVSRNLDLSSHEHHDAIVRRVARVSGAIGTSRILQMGGMLTRIEDLDAHVNETLNAAGYKHAIEREVQGYWFFLLSKGVVRNDVAAEHARVIRAFAGWRQSVKAYLDDPSHGPELIDELGLVDGVHRGYLVLHGEGGRVMQLVEQGSYPRAAELLSRSLALENTAVARTMQEYMATEARIAGKDLEDLRGEAARSRRMLLAGGLVILLMALGVPWVLSRRIIAPILDLQHAALRIGRGDLETRIVVPSTIELASLATTFNDMTGELKVSRNRDLARSEERFQMVTRATMDMIWDWDVRADLVWLDERFRESFGSGGPVYSAAQLLDSIHPDDRRRVAHALDGAIAGTEHFWSDEYRFRRQDGTYAQMCNRGYIVREADGEAVRMIGAMTDVTERRTAEQAIASLHRQKELILNSVGDGVVGLDSEGIIISVNPAGAGMLGYKENDLVGMPIDHVVPQDEGDGSTHRCQDSLIRTTLREGTLQSSEVELFRRADGSRFPAGYVSNPMSDDDGSVIGAVVTFRNITLKHEVDRLKSQFVSTVSHELRTPLTSIRGALGLLSGGLLGPISAKGQRMLEIAVSNTDRLVRLINDILDVERIESETMTMARDVVDVFDLMKRAAEGIQSMADAAGVRLEIEPSTALVLGDADRINQTLTNLLGNAIKFSPRDTTIHLGAHAGNGECTFRLADQGRGVPADKREMIFERFQQVDASDSRDKGGSGLGLAICRSIVNAHGGRIWAEANVPAGTVFQFTIPSTLAAATPATGPALQTLVVCQESDSAMPAAVDEACRAPSILVVEDDVDLARVMTAILQTHGMRTVHAANGREAVELCRQHEPSLIVLDLILPEMDGFAVVSALRESAMLRRVPLLVYSGLDVETDDRERLRLGPTAFLTKSRASLEELEAHIVRLLDTITTKKAEASHAA